MLPVAVIAGTIAKVAASIFTKKTTVTDCEGVESEARKARPVTISLAGIFAALLTYHFLLWPVLNHHFPEYNFPPIDFTILTAIIGSMGF